MSLLHRLSAVAFTAVAVPALLLAQGGGGNQQPPKNLQVLPKDFTRQQVVGVMNGFTAALGVNCAHCHVEEAAPPAGAPAPAGDRRAVDAAVRRSTSRLTTRRRRRSRARC